MTVATAERTNVATLPAPAHLPAVHHDATDILADPAQFEHMQRVAKVFCASALVPEHLRKNIADAFLALAIAKRMGEDPVMVMQNIYFVSGRAGWSAQYMIARANRSGVFKGPIRWRTEGAGDKLAVTAVGRLQDGEEVTATVSMAMAAAEGWTRNVKYKSMGEHMLRWRSATMLIRLYCPEVMMGMPTDDELRDMAPLPVVGSGTADDGSAADRVNALLADAGETVTSDGEIIEPGGTPLPAAGAGEAGEPATSQEPASSPVTDAPAKNWSVNAVGQGAIIKGAWELLAITESDADIDALVAANEERIAKWPQPARAQFMEGVGKRRQELAS